MKPVWNQTRSSAAWRLLCSLVCLRGSWYGSRIYPWWMSWLFGVHALWWDALPIHGTRGSGMVLSQLNVPDFVGFPWNALPFGRSKWGVDWEIELWVTVRRWKYKELWLIFKMNKKLKSKIKKVFKKSLHSIINYFTIPMGCLSFSEQKQRKSRFRRGWREGRRREWEERTEEKVWWEYKINKLS